MTVDTDITSPFQFDWYTQSHASLLGTGRSAHYTVLVDEAKLSADALQAFTYQMFVAWDLHFAPSFLTFKSFFQVLYVCPLHEIRFLRYSRLVPLFLLGLLHFGANHPFKSLSILRRSSLHSSCPPPSG